MESSLYAFYLNLRKGDANSRSGWAQGLWKRMVGKHFKGGRDGLINEAIATLDMALWGLKAKTNDEPMCQHLYSEARRS